ncbi:MAG: four helix bundle protein [Candidatus Nanoarchaeia archaeon]|nr:four helix bundle protein [Candidatus Nanoarchaeia archaeon]
MARNYKNLEIWNLSYELVLDIYKILKKFPEHESDNLISQTKRAATSIPLNIAEGCTRFSKKSFLQFLNYAYGSARELEVLILLAKDLKYISIEEYNNVNDKLDLLSRKLFVFTNKVEKEQFFDWFKR